MKRMLSLKRETLTELTSDDLLDLVGGAALMSGTTCPLKDCLNSNYNCPPSMQRSCMPTCYCTPPPTD